MISTMLVSASISSTLLIILFLGYTDTIQHSSVRSKMHATPRVYLWLRPCHIPEFNYHEVKEAQHQTDRIECACRYNNQIHNDSSYLLKILTHSTCKRANTLTFYVTYWQESPRRHLRSLFACKHRATTQCLHHKPLCLLTWNLGVVVATSVSLFVDISFGLMVDGERSVYWNDHLLQCYKRDQGGCDDTSGLKGEAEMYAMCMEGMNGMILRLPDLRDAEEFGLLASGCTFK